MKLELKHLAAYLPYRLKVKTQKSKDYFVVGVHENRIDLNHEKYLSCSIYLDNEILPILKPMSTLPNEIDKISPTPNFFNIDYLINTPLACSYEVVEKLLELHYDVFGLIEAGLAVDINSLK